MATIKKVFKNRLGSSRFVFADGHEAVFNPSGELYTDDPAEIEALTAETKKNPYIYIDEDRQEVDVEKLDPIVQIKETGVEEFKKSPEYQELLKRAAGSTGAKVETQVQNPVGAAALKVGTSATTGTTAPESNSTQVKV